MTRNQADISMRLNGTHTELSNIFVNSTEYPYMAENSIWYNKISSHNWKNVITNLFGNDTANDAYLREKGFELTEPMKIGLLNVSDVYYSFTNGASGKYALRKSWIFSDIGALNTYEWIAPRYNYKSVWMLCGTVSDDNEGHVSNDGVRGELRVRPTFFLNAGILWTGGSGTLTDPFIIS